MNQVLSFGSTVPLSSSRTSNAALRTRSRSKTLNIVDGFLVQGTGSRRIIVHRTALYRWDYEWVVVFGGVKKRWTFKLPALLNTESEKKRRIHMLVAERQLLQNVLLSPERLRSGIIILFGAREGIVAICL